MSWFDRALESEGDEPELSLDESSTMVRWLRVLWVWPRDGLWSSRATSSVAPASHDG